MQNEGLDYITRLPGEGKLVPVQIFPERKKKRKEKKKARGRGSTLSMICSENVENGEEGKRWTGTLDPVAATTHYGHGGLRQ